jgi:hypothetical protein
MEGYAQKKAIKPFTAKDSYYTTPPWDGIRSESELTSGVRYYRTPGQECWNPRHVVSAR